MRLRHKVIKRHILLYLASRPNLLWILMSICICIEGGFVYGSTANGVRVGREVRVSVEGKHTDFVFSFDVI